jgi:hypothetical protein
MAFALVELFNCLPSSLCLFLYRRRIEYVYVYWNDNLRAALIYTLKNRTFLEFPFIGYQLYVDEDEKYTSLMFTAPTLTLTSPDQFPAFRSRIINHTVSTSKSNST